MRRAATRLALLALAALYLLALPAAAAAAPLGLPKALLERLPPELRAQVSPGVEPGSSRGVSYPSFELRRDGYRVAMIGFGDSVQVAVARPGRRAPVSVYVARGAATPRRLDAKLGQYGAVSMRFRPSPDRPASQSSGCSRRKSRFIEQPGVFVGSFRFRGEDGYVAVEARRAAGSIVRFVPRCPRQARHGRQQLSVHPAQTSPWGFEPDFFVASWRRAVTSALFGALRFPGKTLYIASSEQSEGTVAKLRFALAIGPSRAFDINGPLTFARLSPPAPFRGSGTYRAAPDGSTTWTGALSVSFPGAPHLALTGEPFRPSLAAGF